METVNTYAGKIIEMAIAYAPKILLAITVLLIGMWFINNLVNILERTMQRTGMSEDIRPFLSSLLGVVLKVLLLFSVAGIVGVETTSFVAVLAAAGFAVGMALQGNLSNFAAGVMILVFRPYKVGDLIEVQEQWGHVKEIQIFNTILVTFQNKTVIVPNSMATADIITNYSKQENIRIDLSVTMPYSEDFDRVQGIILASLEDIPKVLQDPAPFVGIDSFDSHNIVLSILVYANTKDYWDVYFEVNRRVKMAMGRNNVQVAYSEGVELGSIGSR